MIAGWSASLLVLLFCGARCVNVLSYADYASFQSSGFDVPHNYAGASLNFSQIYLSAMNTTLFQGYFSNSKAYASAFSMLPISLKMQYPKGFKYNCPAYSSMGINATCLFNYQTILTKIGNFTKTAGAPTNKKVAVGFDFEGANFSSPAFLSYFASYVSAMMNTIGSSGFYNVPIEVFDAADTYAANGIVQNYSAQNFVADMTAILTSNPLNPFYGPGASQNADASWMKTYSALNSFPNFVFSVKCVVFPNISFTIADLLSENNYRPYLLQRLTYDGQTLNPMAGTIAITEIKLCEGVGVDGVTNSFASALWAIDTALEFAMFGGKEIRFLTDISAGNLQSMLGPAPSYAPNPLYYSLLFLTLVSYVGPTLGIVQVTAGSSSYVKVYALTISNQVQFILLNKDTSPSATGVVELRVASADVMECLYLSGGSLAATTNITWAGLTFIGGNSAPQGTYSSSKYLPVSSGTYQVPLAYAQAAICYLGNPASNFPFLAKHSAALAFSLLVLLLPFT